jgi:ketosteroid isomerase-like protein
MTSGTATLSYDKLCDLAVDWCQAWSFGDLDRIMSHYTDDVALNSPNVVTRLGAADDWVRGKEALRAYFAEELKAPGLRFEFVDLLVGAGHVSIVYRRENGALVTDTVEIDRQGRAKHVVACYGRPPK